MNATDGITQVDEPRKRMLWPVSDFRTMFTMPSSGSSINCQTRAATTLEIRNGRITSPRITVDLVSRCRMTAVTSEMRIPMPTDRTTK